MKKGLERKDRRNYDHGPKWKFIWTPAQCAEQAWTRQGRLGVKSSRRSKL